MRREQRGESGKHRRSITGRLTVAKVLEYFKILFSRDVLEIWMKLTTREEALTTVHSSRRRTIWLPKPASGPFSSIPFTFALLWPGSSHWRRSSFQNWSLQATRWSPTVTKKEPPPQPDSLFVYQPVREAQPPQKDLQGLFGNTSSQHYIIQPLPQKSLQIRNILLKRWNTPFAQGERLDRAIFHFPNFVIYASVKQTIFSWFFYQPSCSLIFLPNIIKCNLMTYSHTMSLIHIYLIKKFSIYQHWIKWSK